MTIAAWGAAAAIGVGTALLYPTLIAAIGDIRPRWRGLALSAYCFWRDMGYVTEALAIGLIAVAAGAPGPGFRATGPATPVLDFLGMPPTITGGAHRGRPEKEPAITNPVQTPDDLGALIACPQCDALYRAVRPQHGTLSVCARCHTVIAAPRRKAGMQIISMSLATLVLIVAATFMPFLRVDVGGLHNSTSVLDTALAFSQGLLTLLVILTVAMILALPALRAALVIYVLAPLVLDRPAAPGARGAFRLAQKIRPWAMAEVFAIGCAVALVKITDLAHVEFGIAFWMFAVLVVLVVIQERFMCSWSVWNALNAPDR